MKYVKNVYKMEVGVVDFSVLESKDKKILCSLPPRTTLQKAKNCKWFLDEKLQIC